MQLKVREIKKEILTSFLSISLLVSPILSLKANDQNDNFIVHFPQTQKIKKIKVDCQEETGFVARYYAHNGSYIVLDHLILFKKFLKDTTFYKRFDEKSELASSTFLSLKKNNEEYAVIFTLFKDATLKYYVFTKDPEFTYVIKVGISKFIVPNDVKLSVEYNKDFEYLLKVESKEFGTKYYRSDLLLTDEK